MSLARTLEVAAALMAIHGVFVWRRTGRVYGALSTRQIVRSLQISLRTAGGFALLAACTMFFATIFSVTGPNVVPPLPSLFYFSLGLLGLQRVALPPTVLFLGASVPQAGMLLHNLVRALGGLRIVQLLDPLASRSGPALGETIIQTSSRTGDALRWRDIVRTIGADVPIVVIDVRVATTAVAEELRWLVRHHAAKTLFVVDDANKSGVSMTSDMAGVLPERSVAAGSAPHALWRRLQGVRTRPPDWGVAALVALGMAAAMRWSAEFAPILAALSAVVVAFVLGSLVLRFEPAPYDDSRDVLDLLDVRVGHGTGLGPGHLAKMSPERAVVTLVEGITTHQSIRVRSRSIRLLLMRELPPGAINAVRAALKDPSAEVRDAAIGFFGLRASRGSPELGVVPDLVQAIVTPDARVAAETFDEKATCYGLPMAASLALKQTVGALKIALPWDSDDPDLLSTFKAGLRALLSEEEDETLRADAHKYLQYL